MISHDQLVKLSGDMTKYFEYSFHWPDIFKQRLVFGFPLFVQSIGWLDPTYRILPWVTIGLWIGALYALVVCLRRAFFTPHMILGIIVPLALSVTMRPWLWHGNPYVYANPERLTAILSVVIFGLVVLARREDKWLWYWLLASAVFVSCLVREAMLFLPFVVVAVIPKERMVRALSIIFLLFLGARWSVTGDFSFSSYGAYNATRIYAMLVEPADLKKTPEKFHPLMKEIIRYGQTLDGPRNMELDRASERDLYHRWYNGDFFHDAAIDPYLNANFKTEPERNAFLRSLWGYELRIHWRQRLSIYLRALRIALTKFPDPLLVFGLIGTLWLAFGLRFVRAIDSVLDWYNFVSVVRWFGLWTGFSIGMLLMVQWPDDRYLQVCYFWLPSMLGCIIGFIW